MRKRLFILALLVLMLPAACLAESTEEQEPESTSSFWGGIGDWISGAASDVGEWTSGAASNVGEWISDTATNVWNWTTSTATGAWNGVTDFFNPPETTGNPNIVPEPELPEGTLKMYLGYEV